MKKNTLILASLFGIAANAWAAAPAAVLGVDLIDSKTQATVASLSPNAAINASLLTNKALVFRARIVAGAKPGSVLFGLDSVAHKHNEDGAPFDFSMGAKPAVGAHQLFVSVYSKQGNKGDVSPIYTLPFQVVAAGPVVNYAPVGQPGALALTSGSSISALQPPADAHGQTLSYSVATMPAHGTLNLAANGQFTYTAAADYSGADSLSLVASDGYLSSAPFTWQIVITAAAEPVPNPNPTTPGRDLFMVTTSSQVDATHFDLTAFNKAKFRGGDRIHFAAGQTYTGNFCLHTDGSENADNPVVVDSAGGTQPATLRATNALICPDYKYVGSAALMAYRVNGLELRSLKIEGAGSENGLAIIGKNGSFKHFRISNVEATGFGGNAVVFIGSASAQIRDVVVSNVKLHHNAEGIAFQTVVAGQTAMQFFDVLIDQSEINNNTRGGLLFQFVDGGTVQNSHLHHNGAGGGASVAMLTSQSRHVLAQFNEVDNNQSNDTMDGDGIDYDWGTTDSVAQYNYTHDNWGSGLIVCDLDRNWPSTRIVFHDNISVNDGRHNDYGSIKLSSFTATNHAQRLTTSTPLDVQIYRNTVYSNNANINEGQAHTGHPSALHIKSYQDNTWRARISNNLLITDSTAAGSGSHFRVPLVKITSSKAGNALLFSGNAYWAKANDFLIQDPQVMAGGSGSSSFSSVKAWRDAKLAQTGLAAREVDSATGATVGVDFNALATVPNLTTLGRSDKSADDSNTSAAFAIYDASSLLVGAGIPLMDNGISGAPARDFFAKARSSREDVGASSW